MTRAINRLSRLALAVTVGLGFLFLSDDVSLKQGVSFISHAEARIGRPLTPMSYAGVARRTTRRAVYRGAAVGVAAGAAVGAAPAGMVVDGTVAVGAAAGTGCKRRWTDPMIRRVRTPTWHSGRNRETDRHFVCGARGTAGMARWWASAE
jgi:hypothetical protein